MREIQWASKRIQFPPYLGYFLSLCSVHFEDGEIKRPEVTFAMTAKQSSREEMTGWLDDSEIDPEMISSCALLSLLVFPCLVGSSEVLGSHVAGHQVSCRGVI